LAIVAVVVVLAGGVILFVRPSNNSANSDGLPVVSGPHRVADSGASGAASGGHWVGLTKKWLVNETDPMASIGDPEVRELGTDGTRLFVAETKVRSSPNKSYPPGTVTAYDPADGRKLWQTGFQWEPKTKPIGIGNIVILAVGDRPPDSAGGIDIVALDSTSGKELWRRGAGSSDENPFGKPTFTAIDSDAAAPGVIHNGLFYYADGSTIFALDPMTGQEKFKHTSAGFDTVTGPVVSGDQIVFLTAVNDENTNPDANLHEVHMIVAKPDLSSGTDYTLPKPPPDQPSCEGIVATSVLADGDTILVGSQDALCGFQRTPDNTVKQLWNVKTTKQNFFAPLSGVVPLLDFSGEANHLLVIGLDARTGKQIWTNDPWNGKKPSDDDVTDVLTRSGIVEADGSLFSVGHHLQIIDQKTGKTVFDSTPAGRYGVVGGDALAVAGGTVVMDRADGLWGFN
jgi:outer membrane protein assembly factor BamB